VTGSLVSSVLGDLHILQVTYSKMYFLKSDSTYLETNFPRITSLLDPSVDPSDPNSNNKEVWNREIYTEIDQVFNPLEFSIFETC